MTTAQHSPPAGLPSLLRQLRDDSGALIRQEVELAKTEMKENSANLIEAAAELVLGGLFAYSGVILGLFGLAVLGVRGLEKAGMDRRNAEWVSPVVIGVIVAAVGFVLVSRAKGALGGKPVVPRRTVDSLKVNEEWARKKLSHTP